MPTIVWEDANYFRRIAEVLGVAPDLVMAAYGGEPVDSPLITVLYTPDPDEEDPDVWCAMLWHEGDAMGVQRNEPIGRKFSSFLPPEVP